MSLEITTQNPITLNPQQSIEFASLALRNGLADVDTSADPTTWQVDFGAMTQMHINASVLHETTQVSPGLFMSREDREEYERLKELLAADAAEEAETPVQAAYTPLPTAGVPAAPPFAEAVAPEPTSPQPAEKPWEYNTTATPEPVRSVATHPPYELQLPSAPVIFSPRKADGDADDLARQARIAELGRLDQEKAEKRKAEHDAFSQVGRARQLSTGEAKVVTDPDVLIMEDDMENLLEVRQRWHQTKSEKSQEFYEHQKLSSRIIGKWIDRNMDDSINPAIVQLQQAVAMYKDNIDIHIDDKIDNLKAYFDRARSKPEEEASHSVRKFLDVAQSVVYVIHKEDKSADHPELVVTYNRLKDLYEQARNCKVLDSFELIGKTKEEIGHVVRSYLQDHKTNNAVVSHVSDIGVQPLNMFEDSNKWRAFVEFAEKPKADKNALLQIDHNYENLVILREEADDFNRADYYSLLQIRGDVDNPKVVKRAIRSMRSFYHPDRYRQIATDKQMARMQILFGYIQEAEDTLLDPEKKQRYDDWLENGNSYLKSVKLGDLERAEELARNIQAEPASLPIETPRKAPETMKERKEQGEIWKIDTSKLRSVTQQSGSPSQRPPKIGESQNAVSRDNLQVLIDQILNPNIAGMNLGFVLGNNRYVSVISIAEQNKKGIIPGNDLWLEYVDKSGRFQVIDNFYEAQKVADVLKSFDISYDDTVHHYFQETKSGRQPINLLSRLKNIRLCASEQLAKQMVPGLQQQSLDALIKSISNLMPLSFETALKSKNIVL